MGEGRPVRTGDRLEGDLPVDPLQMVTKLDEQLRQTMASFAETSGQWSEVAKNINGLVGGHGASWSGPSGSRPRRFSSSRGTMSTANDLFSSANQVIGDPKQQQNLRRSLDALPRLVGETEMTLRTVRKTVLTVNTNLENLQG
ncbi:MAG: hypothetical protein CM1200mP2_39540 [Planctomycetaceae bacterium]|nr:MAG: hypothetical protein CM1200mP2_39540 [Planctomycetaceae bacterium]